MDRINKILAIGVLTLMKPRHAPPMKWSIVAITFLGVGLAADLLPHPALGPSIILTGIDAVRGDRPSPVNAGNNSVNANNGASPSIQADSSSSELSSEQSETDFN